MHIKDIITDKEILKEVAQKANEDQRKIYDTEGMTSEEKTEKFFGEALRKLSEE